MLNTAGAIGLFLLGAFALIVAFLSFPSIEYYTGGAIIALFIAGLFYVWGNAIRQTRNIDEKIAREKIQQQQNTANSGSSA